MSAPALPIDAVLSEIAEKLGEAGTLVLQAEPGAGKTTRVPAALLDAGLSGDKAILVLEPRRVAARSAADFVAAERGGRLGGEVGFQVRFERRGDATTRLWFVTEGIAMRRLVGDPFLEDIGLIVLDEFHERHLASDVVLALARELRGTVRPDLKLLVMSATLEVERLARYLGDCPVVRCPGRVYPVDVDYRAIDRDRYLVDEVAAAVRGVCASGDRGDVLVFLPGVGEIRRVGDALAAGGLGGAIEVLPLHGDLPLDAQRRVLRRGDRSAARRVVLATNVAESSVTVDGVTAVVDSGLARVPELDAGRGIERLRTVPISIAAADQRAGRAGRQGPGRCLRLWSASDHAARRQREVPEIRRLDLTATVLELRAWGLGDLAALDWLDAPPQGALQAAERLLRRLGALDEEGRVTALGGQMLRLPAPPRAARLLLEASRRGDAEGGALIAALLSERDIDAGARAVGAKPLGASGDSDLLRRAALFEAASAARFDAATCRRLGVDAGAARAVERSRRQLVQAVDGVAEVGPVAAADDVLLRAIFVAFSDRLARRRAAGDVRAVMVDGGGVRLAAESCVRDDELFVAVEVRGGERRQRAEGTVTLASAVRREWIDEYFAAEVVGESTLELDDSGERVVAVERELFRGLVLRESRRPSSGGAGGELVRRRALADPMRVLALSPRDAMWLRRVDFAAAHGCAVFDGGGEELLRRAIDPLCSGIDSLAELRRRAGEGFVENALSWEQRREVERMAPESVRLPGGRQVRIDYDRVGTPAISARVQELFGMGESPRIAGGAVVVAVEILGPNYRPVQLTDDLAGFWERTYPQVRKELRGRYPKHRWPEDPRNEG